MRPESPKHVSSRSSRKWNTEGILLPESLTAGECPVDLASIFGNAHPVEVEIGTGKGTFLLARAEARPEVNFLGIEWARQYCLYAADRFRRHGLTNVRMIRADAARFFRNCVPAESLLRVHVYFPDPWPKRRHHRRRLIQPGFIEHVRRTLRLGGELLIVTDHLDYFQHIHRVLEEATTLLSVPFPVMADRTGELVGSNFERKYIAQGRAFYSLACLRWA